MNAQWPNRGSFANFLPKNSTLDRWLGTDLVSRIISPRPSLSRAQHPESANLGATVVYSPGQLVQL